MRQTRATVRKDNGKGGPVRALMPLGEGGVYSVSEVCRILQPGMTPRKVHYWLNTDLLSEPPVYRRGSGTPTLLSFRQLLEIRVVQELRDRLGFSLPRVREAFAWLLHSTFAEESDGVSFARAGRQLVARSNLGSIEVPTNQLLLLDEMTAVEASLRTSRYAHDTGLFAIPSHRDDLACNVRI